MPPTFKNLKDVTKFFERIGVRALKEEAEEVMQESQAHFVPVDSGDLHDTGRVTDVSFRAGVGSAILRYGGPDAPYALIVHENPRAGRTGGVSPSGAKYSHWARTGQWKYLETPVRRAAKNFSKRVAARMRSLI